MHDLACLWTLPLLPLQLCLPDTLTPTCFLGLSLSADSVPFCAAVTDLGLLSGPALPANSVPHCPVDAGFCLSCFLPLLWCQAAPVSCPEDCNYQLYPPMEWTSATSYCRILNILLTLLGRRGKKGLHNVPVFTWYLIVVLPTSMMGLADSIFKLLPTAAL